MATAKRKAGKGAARELKGRVAWVIGASGEIGKAIAATLASAGAAVVTSSRKPARAALAAGAVPADLRSRASLERALKVIERRHGHVDVLVNCAAAAIFGDFQKLTDADWETVLQTKLLGYMRSMRAVIPGMVKNGGGSIVNITGRGGRQPTPAHLPGCCANIAVNLLTKGLADIYAASQVRINAVAPGPIESERHHEIARNNAVLTSAAVAKRVPPLGRLGDSTEIAEAVLFLASPRASYITGVTLQVDGGGTATI
jgi:NAD(P)-dependent dehydrogenase (short-subunit alcohol dehydrogenase family)